MEEQIFRADPAGHVVYWVFLVAISLALGGVVCFLLRRPDLRRVGFKGGRAFSRLTSVLAGLAVALPVAGYAHHDCWSRFYGITRTEQGLRLHFLFPARTVDTGRGIAVETVPEARKGRLNHRIVVRTRDGREYLSALVHREAAEEVAGRLAALPNR